MRKWSTDDRDRTVTDWSRLTLGQMWDTLDGQDTGQGTAQSAAWTRTFELLDYHHLRVTEYRARLAEKWRPETSPAAAAFFARVDQMLESIQAMRDAALANGPALSHIVASLAEAKAKLEPVHQQWQADQAKLAAYNPAPAVPGTPSPSPGPPPVSASRQQQLHSQAIAIMSTLAAHTVEAETAMRAPDEYQLPRASFDAGTPFPNEAGAGRGQPSSLRTSHAVPTTPNRTAAGASLAGGSSPTAPTTTTPSAGPPLGVSNPGRPPGSDFPAYPPVPIGGGTRFSTSPSPADGSPRVRALPRGGVIGGSFGEPVREAQPTQRVNPVGGVIGSQPTGESEMFGAPMAGGAPGQRNARSRNRAYDTNEHWPQPTGVPPVLLPPDEPVHDPGPILGPHP